MSSHGGSWYNTSVFLGLIGRPNIFAAPEKQLAMCCRASSVWARRAQSSASSSSVMSSSKMIVCAHTVHTETDVDVIWQVLFCITKHCTDKNVEQARGQDVPQLDAIRNGEAA